LFLTLSILNSDLFFQFWKDNHQHYDVYFREAWLLRDFVFRMTEELAIKFMRAKCLLVESVAIAVMGFNSRNGVRDCRFVVLLWVKPCNTAEPNELFSGRYKNGKAAVVYHEVTGLEKTMSVCDLVCALLKRVGPRTLSPLRRSSTTSASSCLPSRSRTSSSPFTAGPSRSR